MLLHDALAEFLDSRLAAGRRTKTVRFYADNVRSYLSFLEAHRFHGDSWTRPSTFERFCIFERGRGLSDTSINARFRALRAFCSWMVERGYLEKSPMADVEEPRRSVRPPKRIPLEDFRVLVSSISAAGTWMECRDRLLIEMLFWTGLRLGEVVCLEIADLDLAGRLIQINEAKGRRARFVPYSEQMAENIGRYLLTRPATTTPRLYVSSDGGGGVRGPLSHSGVSQMLRRRCQAAGLPRYNAHSFRHGFAMAMLNAGGIEMGVLARLLGHRSSAVTQAIYADWETASLRRAYDAAEGAIASYL